MNDILGILIPMLMSGADIGEILRALGGLGAGAASTDGLSAMLSTSRRNASYAYPLMQNQATINHAAESVIDRIGINPYSGLGQGAVGFLGEMYHIAPDTIGSILGIPNGGQFFSTIANGASAISLASGGGSTDIFNPYSVMDAHRRTVGMARMAYDLGVRKDKDGFFGGYDVSYSHGLNMGEMGKVTQRLLASDIPYREYAENNGELDFSQETGGRLNPSDAADAEKFKKNLKRLGSKFNDTASMLSKLTGSVDEALSLMDRLGGGNFLGGTAEQASEIANKARKMATAIRVTSAIAGISPQESYANMANLQQSMASGMGLSPYVANASGVVNTMAQMAYLGTMAYNNWAAANPDATPEQKKQALFAANGRAQAYANSDGSNLAAIVADNASSFTSDELNNFERSLREGRPDEYVQLIKERVGESKYDAIMTNPELQLATRVSAFRNNRKLYDSFNMSGMEGNLEQADNFGAQRKLDLEMLDTKEWVYDKTRNKDFSKTIDSDVTSALRKMAVEHGSLVEDAEKMDDDDLRRFIHEDGVDMKDIDRAENIARIQSTKRQIGEMTMSDDDERDARSRIRDEIGKASMSDSARQRLLNQLDDGKTGIDAIYKGLARFYTNGKDRTDLLDRVYQGKVSKDEADRRLSTLSQQEKYWTDSYTPQERMAAFENRVKQMNVSKTGSLKGYMFLDDFKGLSDAEALASFARKANELATPEGAARLTVSDVFGGQLGGLRGPALKKFTDSIAARAMQDANENGIPFSQAFARAIDVNRLSDSDKKALGEEGISKLRELQESAVDERTDAGRRLSAPRLPVSIGGGDRGLSRVYGETTRQIVGKVFGSSVGKMDGKEQLDKFIADVSGRVLKGVENGLSFAESFANEIDIGKLTDEQLAAIIGKEVDEKDDLTKLIESSDGIKALKDFQSKARENGEFAERNFSKQTFFSVASGVLEKYGDTQRKSALDEMKKLADGKFGAMDDEKAVGRFLDLYKSVGVGPEIDRDDVLRQLGTEQGKGDGAGKRVITDLVARIQQKGVRFDPSNVMYAAGNVNGAALNLAALDVNATGQTMTSSDLGQGVDKLVSANDDLTADTNQNRIPNAWRTGGASYYREAVKSTEAEISNLRNALIKGGVSMATLKASFGTGETADKAKQQVEDALKNDDQTKFTVGRNKNLLETLKDHTIGGQSGLDVMMDDKKMAAARGQKGSDADIIEITKDINKKDGGLGAGIGGFLEGVGGIIKEVLPVLKDPSTVFKVNITNQNPILVNNTNAQ